MNTTKSFITGLSLSVLLGGTLLFSGILTANPNGGSVTSGSAAILQKDPSYTEIQQYSPHAIIEWKDFSIGAQEHTHFSQPDGGIALNRITGQHPSDILGKLTATGSIVLVNPAGIFFGPDSRVDVGGLIASTADIRNQDFLDDSYHFESFDGSTPATVVNKGLIRVADYGLAALLAPGVENNGVIQANLGRVILGAGKAFSLDLRGDSLIEFQVDVPADTTAVGSDGQHLPHLIQQSGTIMADGGKVLITGRAASDVIDRIIVSDGYVQARSQNGEIILDGGDTGSVYVTGGRLDASHYESDGQGGMIQVLGNRVALMGESQLDVSGTRGGGTVLIGGDYLGGGDTRKAHHTYIGPDVHIAADALAEGNGGKVVVWAEDNTQYHGSISARGGISGGNGGFVETSGKQRLSIANGFVDSSAPYGEGGTWFLDPVDVYIQDTGNTETVEELEFPGSDQNLIPPFPAEATASFSEGYEVMTGTTTIKKATIEGAIKAGMNFVVMTGYNTSNNNHGDIIVNAPITATATGTGNNFLGLIAAKSINIKEPIQLGGADLRVLAGVDLKRDQNSDILQSSSVYGGNIHVQSGIHILANDIKMVARVDSHLSSGNIFNRGSIESNHRLNMVADDSIYNSGSIIATDHLILDATAIGASSIGIQNSGVITSRSSYIQLHSGDGIENLHNNGSIAAEHAISLDATGIIKGGGLIKSTDGPILLKGKEIQEEYPSTSAPGIPPQIVTSNLSVDVDDSFSLQSAASGNLDLKHLNIRVNPIGVNKRYSLQNFRGLDTFHMSHSDSGVSDIQVVSNTLETLGINMFGGSGGMKIANIDAPNAMVHLASSSNIDATKLIANSLAVGAAGNTIIRGAQVSSVAANIADGNFEIQNTGSLTIGNVDDLSGVYATDNILIHTSDALTAVGSVTALQGDVSLEAGGVLSGNGLISAFSGAVDLKGKAIGSNNDFLEVRTKDLGIEVSDSFFVLNQDPDISALELTLDPSSGEHHYIYRDLMLLDNGSRLDTSYMLLDNGSRLDTSYMLLDNGSRLDTSMRISSLHRLQINAKGTSSIHIDSIDTPNAMVHLRAEDGSIDGGNLIANALAVEAKESTIIDGSVSTIAAKTTAGAFNFSNTQPLTVGTVDGIPGISSAGGKVESKGLLKIDKDITTSDSFHLEALGNNSENDSILLKNVAVTLDASSDSTLSLHAGDNIVFDNADVRTQGGGEHIVELFAHKEGADLDNNLGGITHSGNSLISTDTLGVSSSADTSLVTNVKNIAVKVSDGSLNLNNTGDLTVTQVGSVVGIQVPLDRDIYVKSDGLLHSGDDTHRIAGGNIHLFGGNSYFNIRVDAKDSLLVHGYSGGTFFGSVKGVEGPLAAFLADLDVGAKGYFFLNDCLFGDAGLCNPITSIFDAGRAKSIDITVEHPVGEVLEPADIRYCEAVEEGLDNTAKKCKKL